MGRVWAEGWEYGVAGKEDDEAIEELWGKKIWL